MRKCSIAAASLAAVLSAELSSAAYFSDSFDGRVGALTGQIADSGQTWGNFTYFGSYPSFDVGTDYGASGTEGAGTAIEYTFAGNSVSFTQVSSGAVRFETDFTTRGPYPYYSSTTPLKEFFLIDTVHGTAADIYWQQSNESIAFEGLGISDPGQATGQALDANATMHVILNIDLTNKTVQYSWSGLNYDQAGNTFSGSKNLGTYSVDFAPNQLQIWGRGQSSVIASGYDNILFAKAPVEWNVNADGNWSQNSNWTAPAPNAIGETALFGSKITAAHIVTVDVPVTVGKIQFDNTNAYTLAGSNTLTLDDSSGASILVSQGAHNIDAPVALNANTTVTVSSTSTLTVSGQVTAAAGVGLTKSGFGTLAMKNVRADGLTVNAGRVRVIATGTANAPNSTSVVKSLAIGFEGRLDLGNNSLIIDYTGALGTLASDTRLNLEGGQLNSSAADASHRLGYADNGALGLSSFVGQTVDADSLLIKFTYGGDANLDGQVDISDLGALATAWQTSAPWTGGDFDYSGFVDISDLGILATNWQLGVGSPLGPSFDEALAAVGLTGVSVPEPAGISLLALGTVVLLKRRRMDR